MIYNSQSDSNIHIIRAALVVWENLSSRVEVSMVEGYAPNEDTVTSIIEFLYSEQKDHPTDT